jgi:enoyl-CoA hydratase/carnithine racemase
MDIAMLPAMHAALEAAAHEPMLKVLALRAENTLRGFFAGVDLADRTADRVGERIPLFDRVCAALADFLAPTMAVVHRHALGGGCELALCCDLVIAA